MKKMERNELFLSLIVADLRNEILFIPKRVKENARKLSSAEASLYFEFKNRYPEFAEVIV